MRNCLIAGLCLAASVATPHAQAPGTFDLAAIERPRILTAADRLLAEAPVTVTSSRSLRSAGGVHDFFSEGDYWWPDPKNPDGPYIQRDGMTNPDNFVAHRQAMIRFSIHVGTLTSAYVLTQDERYAAKAATHLRAWFIDPATRMNPSLLYAQAIKGRFTGRGVGIIDTIHLVEVARAVPILSRTRALPAAASSGCTNSTTRLACGVLPSRATARPAMCVARPSFQTFVRSV